MNIEKGEEINTSGVICYVSDGSILLPDNKHLYKIVDHCLLIFEWVQSFSKRFSKREKFSIPLFSIPFRVNFIPQ